MNRSEDKHVKIPAVIHATRLGYTYRSIKCDVSGMCGQAMTTSARKVLPQRWSVL